MVDISLIVVIVLLVVVAVLQVIAMLSSGSQSRSLREEVNSTMKGVCDTIVQISQTQQSQIESMRTTVEQKLTRIQEDNAKKLEDMGLIKMEFEDPSYKISITKEGVLYLRKYNEFYISMYEDIIKDHYKFRQIPAWFRTKE